MKSWWSRTLACLALICGALHAATSIRTVYIVPSSHYDRGFVVPPSQIPAMAARHINEVIDQAEKDPDFRWTIESVWQVLAFIDQERGLGDILPGRPDRIQLLMKLIRSGRIDLSAAWGSMHTEFLGAEELNRLMYDYAALHRTYGIESHLAVLNDVPGQPWSLASALAGSGVRYLLVGANQFVGGGTSLSPGNVPFYWQGPDGKRVLTWVSQSPRGGYTEGITDYFLDPFTKDPYTQTSGWKIFNPKTPEKSPLDSMQAGMDILLKRLADAGYRYEAVLVMHVHDFLHPSTVESLEQAVRLWNGAHKTPELRIATASEFFRYMEEKYGSTIPTASGEWAGLWSEAKTSSPQISALARRAHDEVPAAETLWSALALEQGVPFPAGDLYELYHLLFNYDEHSGAGNVGWPGLNSRDTLEQQNVDYAAFMQQASNNADYLLRTGVGVLTTNEAGEARVASDNVMTWPLVVWNSLSWQRTDVVTAPAPETGWHIIAVRDRRNGRPVPFDVDADGKALFIAHDVPSVGYAVYDVDESPGPATSTLAPVSAAAAATENDRYRVTLTPNGDISSILDRRDDRELVNAHPVVRFNHFFRSEGDQPAPAPMPFAPAIATRRGQVVSEVEVRRAGSAFPVTRIRLYGGLDRVEIHNEVDSTRLPFASMRTSFDSYYFAFPFALDPGSLTVHPEEQFGFLSLPRDYLAGARRDSVTSQHAVALADSHATMLLAHRQAFYFLFPGYLRTERTKERPAFPAMFTGKWPLPEATLYSRAFRHSNQGDMRLRGVTTFPTVEPGLGDRYNFDYAIGYAAAPFDAVAAMHFGAAFDVPLRAVYVPFAAASSGSFFAVNQPNVRIDTVKQAESLQPEAITPTNLEDAKQSRQFVIRLQEVAGRDTPHASIALPGPVVNAEVVDLTEDKVIRSLPASSPLEVALKPYQTLTIRFEMKHE